MQPRDQPFDRHGDIDLDHQLAGQRLAAHQPGALGDAVEGVAQEGVIGGPRLGQLDPAGFAPEERRAQAPLEAGDLVADGRLGDGQLLRRGAEAAMAGGRLEGPERGQRRQSAGTHARSRQDEVHGSLYMNSIHRSMNYHRLCAEALAKNIRPIQDFPGGAFT